VFADAARQVFKLIRRQVQKEHNDHSNNSEKEEKMYIWRMQCASIWSGKDDDGNCGAPHPLCQIYKAGKIRKMPPVLNINGFFAEQ
jgi:hypothetical protein